MKIPQINLCINGTFRYPQYAALYYEKQALNCFYFSHRISTRAQTLGVPQDKVRNLWLKEYLLQASLRYIKPRDVSRTHTNIGELWQRQVVRDWRDADSVEAVIGEIADRVLAHARGRGARTVGHPVNSHPSTFADLVNREIEQLGLSKYQELFKPSARRLDEIDLCDRLIVDSTFVRDSYVQHGYCADHIAVIPPGNDTVRFAPRKADEVDTTSFKVVCVGQISPRKGQYYLLKAWRALKLKDAELILVGRKDAAAESYLSDFADDFTYVEHIPNADLRALLASASAFVLPSVEDGFSQAAMEAISCGVPTIVTKNNGVADVIDNGRNGIIVPAANYHAIAEALLAIYIDSDYRNFLGKNAVATARKDFDWSKYVDLAIGVHSRLVHGT